MSDFKPLLDQMEEEFKQDCLQSPFVKNLIVKARQKAFLEAADIASHWGMTSLDQPDWRPGVIVLEACERIEKKLRQKAKEITND